MNHATEQCPLPLMEERNEKKEKITGDDIEKVTLEPISKSKEDKELQEWEVESTGGELGAGGG